MQISKEVLVKNGEYFEFLDQKSALNPVLFIKENFKYGKIRDLKNEDYDQAKQFIRIPLERHYTLIGLKGEMDQILGHDIINLILNHFSALTPLEINKALELERHGQYEQRTEHYQLFNSEYISEILKKYLKWKQKIRDDFNITHLSLEQPQEMTQREKDQTRAIFLKLVFEEIQQKGYSSDAWLLHDQTRHLHNICDDVRKRYYKIKERKYLIESKNKLDKNIFNVGYREVYNQAIKKRHLGQTLTSVVNECKARAFCHFVRKSKIKDFEGFKNVFKN